MLPALIPYRPGGRYRFLLHNFYKIRKFLPEFLSLSFSYPIDFRNLIYANRILYCHIFQTGILKYSIWRDIIFLGYFFLTSFSRLNNLSSSPRAVLPNVTSEDILAVSARLYTLSSAISNFDFSLPSIQSSPFCKL